MTSEEISRVITVNQVFASILMFIFVYGLFILVFINLLKHKTHHGPDEDEKSAVLPESWRLLAERKQSARL